jgi:hypothetical protein
VQRRAIFCIISALAFLAPPRTPGLTREDFLAWWDMLFGTYENPKEWTHTCGFDDDKAQQLFRMLAFKDVHHEAPNAVSARE